MTMVRLKVTLLTVLKDINVHSCKKIIPLSPTFAHLVKSLLLAKLIIHHESSIPLEIIV